MNDSYIDVYHNPPPSGKKMPILIFCQGSGYDSNTGGFLGLLRKFDSSVVGLGIEKQGVHLGDKGDSLSPEYIKNNTVYNRLYDYLRVLQYMRAHASWWNGEVYVIGGSEGGLLAGMLASYYPNVRSVAILCFGGGLSFGEAWPIAAGLQNKVENMRADSIELSIRQAKDTLAMIRNNNRYDLSYSGSDNSYAWWNSIMDLRLSNVLLDVNVPIFLGQGTEDLMAPPESAEKLNAAFVAAGKKNLFYKLYPGYDHGFNDKNEKSHLSEVFREAIKWMLDGK